MRRPPRKSNGARRRRARPTKRGLLYNKVDLTRQDQSLVYRLREITKLFGRTLTAGPLAQLGITHSQWRCLRALWEQDGVSQRELSQVLDLTSAGIVFAVNLLERDGLAERRHNPHDAREALIFLTRKGRSLRRASLGDIRRLHVRAFSDFSDREILQFSAMIYRLKRDLKQLVAELETERR